MLETLLFAFFWQYFFGISLTIIAIFLILLVLVQRGRGGGLAGAFGGMGGQSAFGTKAGDTFTKVTIGASIVWLLLCIASVKFLGSNAGAFGKATAPAQTQFNPLGGTPPALPETTSPGPSDSAPSDSAPESGAADTGDTATPEPPTDAK